MVSKYSKIIIPFFLVLSLVVTTKFYSEYLDIQELKQMVAENESRSISNLIKAFRGTYQKAFAEHAIAIDDKTIELLPVRTISQISKRFSKLMHGKVNIRTISQNPANQEHLALPNEQVYFDYFKKNPNANSWLNIYAENSYLIAEPIYVKKGCLKCHGEIDQVIDVMRNKYSTGYGYKVNDIIGVQLIRYEENDFSKKLDFIFKRNIITAAIVFISVFLAIYFMLRLIGKKESAYQASLQAHNEELKKITITDHLTGLGNRKHFAQVAEVEVNRAKRNLQMLAFAMLDLDNFKKFNDTYGHQKGDELLKRIGGLLQEKMARAEDFKFRLGGEEFLAIYYIKNVAQAGQVAERLRQAVENLQVEHINNTPFGVVTTSVGVALARPDTDTSSDKLYKNADIALYQAKNSGRNKVIVAD